MTAPLPPNETARLEALRRYRILDTSPEAAFDDFVKLASIICDTPIPAITLLDENRQWFKAKVGLQSEGTPRDQAFCAHAIFSPEMLVVPNAEEDARFADNPLVTGDLHIRFYAGMPLMDTEGNGLGALCVIDRKARELNQAQKEALAALSRRVIEHFQLRLNAIELAEALEDVKTLHGLLPICSYCKSIRNDHGYWDKLESYLSKHSEADFSHGICPDCTKEHFPSVYAQLQAEGKL